MIIIALYNGAQVQLNVSDGYLVLDGNRFVPPSQAQFVTLLTTTPGVLAPENYPIQELGSTIAGSVDTVFCCQVVSVNPTPEPVSDVVTSVDPLAGACLCGVTCFGTQIMNVPIVQS